MGKFQKYMVEEGFLDCVSHGVKEGWKAFSKKRIEEKKQDKKQELSQKMLTAEGDQLKQLVKQMVTQNLTINKEGKVEDERRLERKTKATAWLSEHVRSQGRDRTPQNTQG